MPITPAQATQNGNAVGAFRSNDPVLGYRRYGAGRVSGLLIYEVEYHAVKSLLGTQIERLLRAVTAQNPTDYRGEHADHHGHLPNPPGGRTRYREYHIPGNAFEHNTYPRLVYDSSRHLCFLTPTHYEIWNDGANQRNPFYLLRNAPGCAYP